MKTHWVDMNADKHHQQDPNETYWRAACGLFFTDEEVVRGHASPLVGDATCGSCRRVAAAQVEMRLTKGVLQEIPF